MRASKSRAFTLCAAVGWLTGLACFDGEDSWGLPCENDDQCGDGITCEEGICGGPDAADDGGSDSGTGDDGGSSGTTSGDEGDSSGSTGQGGCADGDGTFEKLSDLPAGTDPMAVSVGDFNDDGDLDIVAGGDAWGEGFLTIYLNDGNRGFMPNELTPDAGVREVLGIDVNGDFVTDVVAAVGNSVVVWPGREADTVDAPVSTEVGDLLLSLEPIELNDDGYTDLLVGNSTGAGFDDVFALLSNGDGTFTVHSSVEVGYGPFSLAVGDIDDDEDLDLLVANADENGASDPDVVNVFLNLTDGDGTFTGFQELAPPVPTGNNPWGIAFGDLDGDGSAMFVTADSDDEGGGEPYYASIFYYDDVASGFVESDQLEVGESPRDVAIADLNCDDTLDIVVTNQGEDTVGVLLNTGNGEFEEMVAYDAGDGPGSAIAVADLDWDGKPDIVVPNFNDGTVTVLMGQ